MKSFTMKKQIRIPGKTKNPLKTLILFIKHKAGWLGSPKIVPFTGFANKNNTYISGEVVEENGISKPTEGQSKWQNTMAMIKRYLSNEIEDIKVKVTYMGMSQVVTTNRFGIFRCHFEHKSETGSNDVWLKASISLLDSNKPEVVEGEVMMIRNLSQFGIISDIDDTILVSYAARKLMKLRLMLLNNAYTRMPFEGVSAFYDALQRGTSDDGFNPIFYVSNSEWNLYDLLYEFIQFNRIPKGPLFLREMAIRAWPPWKMREVNRNHKIEVISRIFSLYAGMKFILLGDSGQKDPDVYWKIVKQFPGRVLAIYIRDVRVPGNLPEIRIISQKLREEFKIEMVLVKDTEAAAMHAIEHGFISGEYLRSILLEKRKDIRKRDQVEEKLI